MNDLARCPVCQHRYGGGKVFQGYRISTGDFRVKCGVCGDFDVSLEALEDYLESAHETRLTPIRRALLSHLVRSAQVAGSHDFIIVKRDLIERVVRDEISAPSVSEQAIAALRIIGAESKALGEPLKRLPEHLYAIIGAANPDAAARLVGDLISRNLLRSKDASSMDGQAYISVEPTLDGWEALSAQLTPKPPTPGIIVMKFNDAELDAFVDQIVKPAAAAAGFSVERVCESPRAGQIELAMKQKLAAAPFVIAELTHQNSGAYWEAGYADGKDVPVIYMCREAEWMSNGGTHFDTSHHETIIWRADQPDAFHQRLIAVLKNSVKQR